MKQKSSPNRLLQGFILVSLGVHVFLILHFSGIYKSSTLSYLELSMDQTDRPHARVIPKPRSRRTDLKIADVRTPACKDFQVPRIPMEEMPKPETVQDTISLPDLPDTMEISKVSGFGPGGAGFVPAGASEGQIHFSSAKDYFEMLNLRVQRFKQYPESARSSHIEGRVHLEFVLQKDGTLSNIKILKSSHHKNLDDAAVDALKNASPFPKPPDFLFKGPVTMRINILFELA